ncbi:hypothetical protein LTR08_001973 [Meristemomyces frigidus]|nr:hypothetical protein LTR08_001973 [Meristemomyces frigidus]
MSKRSREDSASFSDGAAPGAPLLLRTPSAEPAVHTPKYALLDTTKPKASSMRCHLPPHKPLSFGTYAEYETHCQQAHTNRCTDCKKNLPTSHFLDLHIAENHDPIVAARRERGEKTYACFVEGCDKVCGEWQKRRSHMVDKHGYPRNYDFFIVNTGVDGRRSMLRAGVDAQGHRKSSRERRGSSATETTQSTEASSASEPASGEHKGESRADTPAAKGDEVEMMARPKETAVDDLASSMSSLKMVPRSVTFGKRGRAGFARS